MMPIRHPDEAYWGCDDQHTNRSKQSSSPFAPAAEVEVAVYAVGERVCHDLYGLGTVTAIDPYAVTVDFGGSAGADQAALRQARAPLTEQCEPRLLWSYLSVPRLLGLVG